MKGLAADILPPLLTRTLRRLAARMRGDWVLSREGWTDAQGWDSPSVSQAQRKRWPAFVAELAGTAPLDCANSRVGTGPDLGTHNTVMAYGYVLGRAAHARPRVRVLDWGGGLGHYHLLGAALFPDVAIEYTCVDLPHTVQAGRELQPNVRFTDAEADALNVTYDLVLASSSLHYSKDWRAVARTLARVCDGFVYVTRLPVVEHATSFVVRQKAYDTAYCGWFLNRAELIGAFTSAGLALEREFLIDEHHVVDNAPEQACYRGFLFRAGGTAAP